MLSTDFTLSHIKEDVFRYSYKINIEPHHRALAGGGGGQRGADDIAFL